MKRVYRQSILVVSISLLAVPAYFWSLDDGGEGPADDPVERTQQGPDRGWIAWIASFIWSKESGSELMAFSPRRSDTAEKKLKELLKATGITGARSNLDRNTLLLLSIHVFVEAIHDNPAIWEHLRNGAGTIVPHEIVNAVVRAYHARYGRSEKYKLLQDLDGQPYPFDWTIADAINAGSINVGPELDLRGTGITTLDGITEIPGIQRVTFLNLVNTRIRELPPGIGQLRNLRILDLRGTQITELPPEIGQLRNLESLNLINTLIGELPHEIGQLRNLRILDLGFTLIGELPPEIGQLRNLTHLYLDGTQIKELPPEIGQLGSLQVLSIGFTQIRVLPSEIGQLRNLRRLIIDNIPIKELPPGVNSDIVSW